MWEWFHETFPTVTIPAIGLLHLDCDFHDPTQLCLKTWHPKVIPGGFVQIDDYDSFHGCRFVVDEFLTNHPAIKLETVSTNDTANFFAKPQ